jgi:hypothetical protein
MNVAVLEPVASPAQDAGARGCGLDAIVGQVSEWIDPEGDDWFAAVYREVARDPRAAVGEKPATELEHWFG